MSKNRGNSSLRLTGLFNVGAKFIIPNSKSPVSVSILLIKSFGLSLNDHVAINNFLPLNLNLFNLEKIIFYR